MYKKKKVDHRDLAVGQLFSYERGSLGFSLKLLRLKKDLVFLCLTQLESSMLFNKR